MVPETSARSYLVPGGRGSEGVLASVQCMCGAKLKLSQGEGVFSLKLLLLNDTLSLSWCLFGVKIHF